MIPMRVDAVKAGNTDEQSQMSLPLDVVHCERTALKF
jgi:hypothetical protein